METSTLCVHDMKICHEGLVEIAYSAKPERQIFHIMETQTIILYIPFLVFNFQKKKRLKKARKSKKEKMRSYTQADRKS